MAQLKKYPKAKAFCAQVLAFDPDSEFGLLSKAQTQIDAEEYEAAVNTMSHAQEHHKSQKVNAMAQEAATLLRRSKQKDYYKVLDVARDADERAIKKAYRKLSKENHPDKVVSRGVPKEEAERKMAAINEAYETLKDPELRARVDRGDDPNDPNQQQGGQPFHGSPFGNGHPFMFRQGSGADGHFNFHFAGNGFG